MPNLLNLLGLLGLLDLLSLLSLPLYIDNCHCLLVHYVGLDIPLHIDIILDDLWLLIPINNRNIFYNPGRTLEILYYILLPNYNGSRHHINLRPDILSYDGLYWSSLRNSGSRDHVSDCLDVLGFSEGGCNRNIDCIANDSSGRGQDRSRSWDGDRPDYGYGLYVVDDFSGCYDTAHGFLN